MSCEDVKGLEGVFVRGSLDKVFENLFGLSLFFVFVFFYGLVVAWSGGVESVEENIMKFSEKRYICKGRGR